MSRAPGSRSFMTKINKLSFDSDELESFSPSNPSSPVKGEKRKNKRSTDEKQTSNEREPKQRREKKAHKSKESSGNSSEGEVSVKEEKLETLALSEPNLRLFPLAPIGDENVDFIFCRLCDSKVPISSWNTNERDCLHFTNHLQSFRLRYFLLLLFPFPPILFLHLISVPSISIFPSFIPPIPLSLRSLLMRRKWKKTRYYSKTHQKS